MVWDHKVFQDTKSSPVQSHLQRWKVTEEQDSLEEEPVEGGRAQRTRQVGGASASVLLPQIKEHGGGHLWLPSPHQTPPQLLMKGKRGKCLEEDYGPALSNRNVMWAHT